MTLGVFLAIGESFADFAKKGQHRLLIDQNLFYYSQAFERVFVFSYESEKFTVHGNVYIEPNRWRMHRYLYSLLLPFFYAVEIKQCDVLRGLQLTGGIPGVVAKILYHKPMVINYGYRYQEFAKKEGKYLQAFLYWLIESLILKLATAIIVTSKALRRQLKAQFKAKLFLIPNSVDTHHFRPARMIRHKRKKTILYVGRFEPMKNLSGLIKAVSLLSQQDTRLLLIGSGSQREYLMRFAKNLGVHAEVINTVPHDRLPSYFNKADVFVLPSIEEGHPKALLEAMACGLAVVGSDVLGIRGLIQDGENGLLCQPEAKSIAQTVERLIRDSVLRKKLGKNARDYVVAHFNIKRTLAMEIALLKRIVVAGRADV